METNEFSILVVDDEEIMRKTLGELLRLEGYQVLTASNGDEALELIVESSNLNSRLSIDLILLDLKMPGRDGLDVLRKSAEILPETQIILLTAHGSMQSAIEALRQGALDYLLKPASPDQILKSVRRGLEQRAEHLRRIILLRQLESSIQALNQPSSQAVTSEVDISAKENIIDHQGTVLFLSDGTNLDLKKREITKGDARIYLTPSECKLLVLFLSYPERVFSHRELVARVQGYEVSEREAPDIIRPLISRLRRKLTQLPQGRNRIASIRATGYIFKPN